MDLQSAEKLMQDAVKHLEGEFMKMQVGRASTAMVEEILVTAYGTTQPLRNIASISTPDPKTIMIQPWDKAIMATIEGAIRERSDMGFNPMNDGNVVRINLPQPTEDRRRDLVKVAHAKGEDAKISIRNARQKVHTSIKEQLKEKEISEDEGKAMEKELQEVVDRSNKHIDEMVKAKEKDIMTV